MTTPDVKAYLRNHPRVDFSKANANDPSDITFKLYTKDSPSEYTIVTADNVGGLGLNKNVKTVVIIHGWNSSDSAHWIAPLKDAYLKENDYNIICVNYSKCHNISYRLSSANALPVGEFIADFLTNSGMPPKHIHLIGHSLGGQVSSFTAKAYERQNGEKIGRISGLDPAGPLWANKNMKKEERLSELDADFVDVTHTDIQMYGYTHPCGHVDFYPNGGTNQPGCPDEKLKENWNHQLATRLFIESVNQKASGTEIYFKEDEDHNIIITHKENSDKVIFGEHMSQTARGVYYLKTSDDTPFLAV